MPLLLRRLHDQPAAGGPHGRQGLGRHASTRVSRCRASTAARRACSFRTSTSGRAPSGSQGLRVMDHDEPGFWEIQRLPQPRRPVEGAAVLDGLTPVEQRAPGPVADRHGRPQITRGDAAREVVSHRAADVDGAPAGPALRRAPDRARRLPGAALLLDRLLAARRGRDRAHDRPARGRRGLAVLPRRRRWRATRSRCAARSPPTSSGAARAPCCWSAAAPAWCR